MRVVLLALVLMLFSARWASACSVDVEAVVFGNIDLTRSNTANGRITVECPSSAVYALSIRSEHDGADRLMTGPDGRKMRYQLYADPGFVQLWGDGGTTGPSVGGSVAAGSVTEYTVYGRVPKQTLLPAGSYADLPIVTLLY